MWRALAWSGAALAGSVALAVAFGAWRWRAATAHVRTQLEAGRAPARSEPYSAAELGALPPPVQRYFRAVLHEGQPIISAVTLRHAGVFNQSSAGAAWKPFVSEQRVITNRPGFDWDARIASAPGLGVRVRDAYAVGEGMLHAAVAGLVTVVDLRGGGEIARGQLMRYLAESAWYPTALLPGQNVQWQAVDASSARATLTDGELSVTLLFRFDAGSLIESVRADARGRTIDGEIVPTPWEGRFSRYEVRNGVRIPLEGEVSWTPHEGRLPYWRARTTFIEYEYARDSEP